MHPRHCLHGRRYLGFVRNKKPDLFIASDFGCLFQAQLYHLHPCRRPVLSRHTTAMDGGSVDNAGAIIDQSIPSNKKRGLAPPFLLQLRQQLLVVDVHGDFEAKTNVTVFWSFPFHVNSPHIVVKRYPDSPRHKYVHNRYISIRAKF